MSGTLVVIALGLGACWLCLALVLIGGRLVYDVSLGSLRTAPEAWPVRGGEALPKRAAPVLSGGEVGALAAPARRAPVVQPARVVAPRRPVAPVTPVAPVQPVPAPDTPAVVEWLPERRSTPAPEPVEAPAAAADVAA